MTARAAAVALGVSEDTIARRRKSGFLPSRQVHTTSGSRWLVQLPDDVTVPEPAEAGARAELTAIAERLERLEPMLLAQLAAKDRQIAELHVLLQRAQEAHQVVYLPPAGTPETERHIDGHAAQQHVSVEPGRALRAAWEVWRKPKRGLGASLTVTGFVAVILGIALHFALRAQFIEATIRLGYVVGLTGLILLLLGLILVF